MLRDKLDAIYLAMEAINDGQVAVEREFTYYGKIVDRSELENAERREEQEQWSLRVDNFKPVDDTRVQKYAGEIRVRRTRPLDGENHGTDRFMLTVKSFSPSADDAKKEAELEITEDLFKMVRQIANGGMVKVRYYFPRTDGTTWEVDVFKDAEGNDYEWCKIDLEVEKDQEAPTDFPIQINDVINGDFRKRTEEERDQVKRLMDEVFVLKNQFAVEKQTNENEG